MRPSPGERRIRRPNEDGFPRGPERLARTALAGYDLDVDELSLITNDYNCTFRVETADGERYVLRVNLPHRRRDEEIYAELTWLAALSRDTDIIRWLLDRGAV